LKIGTVSPDVLVCGDPARADMIAEHLSDAQILAEWREYRTYQGMYNGRIITVTSHGIGAPGAAIAFEELIVAGAKKMIRVGSCGSLQPDLGSGDLVIASAAVQNTGYGRETVPDGFPAVADMDVTLALRHAAAQYGHPYRVGIALTRDSFYAGVQTNSVPSYQQLSAANVLAVEMECSALFIVGTLRNIQTGAILAVDGNVLADGESMSDFNPHRDVVAQAFQAEIVIALQAVSQVGIGE
jgi:uridine phosphorylase